jgi:hypothetical protein
MLLNLSNHHSSQWGEKQKRTAQSKFGTVVDMDFPLINPDATTDEVIKLALTWFDKITAVFDECANEPFPNAVHIQGEFVFVFHLVTLLKSSGISCVASTSFRDIKQVDNKKIITFNFVQFRQY